MSKANPLTRAKKIRALEFFRTNRLAEAKSLYSLVSKEDRQDVEAWSMLGAINGMLGGFGEAEMCCRKVIELQPRAVGAYNNLANALKFQEKLAEAEAAYRQALGLQPDYAEAHNNLGTLLKEQNRLPEAESAYRNALRYQPSYPEAQNNLGTLVMKQGRLDEAVQCYSQAIRLNPAYADAYYNLGITLHQQERHDDAIACFKRVLQISPAHVDALLNLGGIFQRQNILDEALSCFRHAIELNPSNEGGLLAIGAILKQKGMQLEAIEAYQQALQINPNSIEANYSLATLGVQDAPSQSPNQYVKQLFDDYADKFEQHLVNELHYQTPDLLLRAVKKSIGNKSPPSSVLDFGCGTGLCGPLFRGMASRLIGIDLSPRMVEKAQERNVYDEVLVGDETAICTLAGDGWDLILAADVLVYIGDLSNVFDACKSALKLSGRFAFSIETLSEGGSYALRSSGRYAHSVDYVRDQARIAGLNVSSVEDVVLRQEAGKPMLGNLFILQNRAVNQDGK